MKQGAVAICLGWIIMMGCACEDVAEELEVATKRLGLEHGETSESGISCRCASKHASEGAPRGDAGEQGHAGRCAHHDGGSCPHHDHEGGACACHGADRETVEEAMDAGTHTHGP